MVATATNSLITLIPSRRAWWMEKDVDRSERLLGEATRTTTADAHAGCNAPETRDERAARGSTGVGIDGGRER